MTKDLWITDFGVFPDGSDDSWPGFQRAFDRIRAEKVLSGGPNLRFPVGDFRLSGPLNIEGCGFNMIGSAGGMSSGNGTVLSFARGMDGIRIGADADGSRIEDMKVRSDGQQSGLANSGITLNRRAIVHNVLVEGFPGDGIQVDGLRGNCNGFEVHGGRTFGNVRHGVHVFGHNANAGIIQGHDAALNGRWGFLDLSVFGNLIAGTQSEANGWSLNGVTKHHARAYHKDHWWLLMLGQDENGGLVEPGTNEMVWEQLPTGAVGPQPDVPQWERGETYETGGPYGMLSQNGQNGLLLNAYSESGQPPAQVYAPWFALWGLPGAGYSKRSNVFAGGKFSGGLTFQNPSRGLTAELMQNAENGDILSLWDAARLPAVNRFRIDEHDDLIWDIANSLNVFRIVQPGSWRRYGRSRAPVGAFHPLHLFTGLDNGVDAREISHGHGPPTFGERGQGDFRFNLFPAPGADLGWTCIQGGEPGVWVSAGKIPAA